MPDDRDAPRYTPPPSDRGEFVKQIIREPDPTWGAKIDQARIELGQARAHEHMRKRAYVGRRPRPQ
jgi:hypothetical protein